MTDDFLTPPVGRAIAIDQFGLNERQPVDASTIVQIAGLRFKLPIVKLEHVVLSYLKSRRVEMNFNRHAGINPIGAAHAVRARCHRRIVSDDGPILFRRTNQSANEIFGRDWTSRAR
jgi:hypothetical protein